MPPILSKPSSAAPASLFYITLGALMTVWSGVWFWYLRNNSSGHQVLNYICTGCLITGVVLLAIGFTLGPLSRMARHAELPPTEVTNTAIRTEENASAPRA